MNRTLPLCVALLLAGCSSDAPAKPPAAGASSPSAPATSTGQSPAPTAMSTPSDAMTFSSEGPVDPRLSSQPGWIEREPSGSMRVAEYELPAQGEDSEPAELVVYSFPSVAGPQMVEMNFSRWAGQLSQADGGSSMEAAARSERVVRGMRVHQIDVSGRYVAETMPGSGERVDKPGWRLLGAVVETGGDPYYVKLTGPEATVAHWKASYEAFLSEM